MVYISPLNGKEVSKATYYRHVKKSQFQSHVLPGNESEKDLKASIVELFNQGQSKHEIAMEFDLDDLYVDDVLNEFKSLIKRSQSQSQSHEKVVPSVQDIINDWQDAETRYQRIKEVFKDLFLAASSRGIPKKIVQECERFL